MINKVPNRELELLKQMFVMRRERKKRRKGRPAPEPEQPREQPQEQPPAPEPLAARPQGVEDYKRKMSMPVMASKTRVEGLPAGRGFVQGLVARGWSPEEAAAAAGNAHVESGFRPSIKSGVANENSFGFLQWNNERLRGLQTMAEAQGRDWTDPDVQLDYIHAERTGESVKFGGTDERRAYERALAGGSPEDMAERFGRFVERPLRLSDTVSQRRAAAAQYFRGI